MASLQKEIGCPGTWGTGTADPKPKQPEQPRARPSFNRATSPADQKNPEAAPAPVSVTLNWKNSGKLTE